MARTTARGIWAVVLGVADSGSGIEPEHLPILFERFARPNGDRGRGRGGTGLGLAIVRAVAEAHGGTVEAESIPGKGSHFRILLPRFEPRTADRHPAPDA